MSTPESDKKGPPPKNPKLDDIIYFKEEILKEFKQFQGSIKSIFDSQNITYTEKFDNYDLKIQAMSEKILSISSQLSGNILFTEKMDNLFNTTNKLKDSLSVLEIKTNTELKELRSLNYQCEKLISDNIIYTGIIGNKAKFRDFHEFIDHTLSNISTLNTFKDKALNDIKNNKKNIDNINQGIKLKFDTLTKNNKEYTNKIVEKVEERINNFYKEYDSKLEKIKYENEEIDKNLKDKMEYLSKNFRSYEQFVNSLDNCKHEINKLWDSSDNLSKLINQHQNEYNEIVHKINYLSDSFEESLKLIKNLPMNKFKGSSIFMGKDSDQENKLSVMNNNTTTKRPIKRRSVLKDYIEGKIGVDELKTGKMNIKEYKTFDLDSDNLITNNKISKEIDISIQKGIMMENTINDNLLNEINDYSRFKPRNYFIWNNQYNKKINVAEKDLNAWTYNDIKLDKNSNIKKAEIYVLEDVRDKDKIMYNQNSSMPNFRTFYQKMFENKIKEVKIPIHDYNMDEKIKKIKNDLNKTYMKSSMDIITSISLKNHQKNQTYLEKKMKNGKLPMLDYKKDKNNIYKNDSSKIGSYLKYSFDHKYKSFDFSNNNKYGNISPENKKLNQKQNFLQAENKKEYIDKK